MGQPMAPSPPTTRQRITPLSAKKNTKEHPYIDSPNTKVRSKDQALTFLQGKEYLALDMNIDLLTLAHVLFQFDASTMCTPKILTDGIRAVAFLLTNLAAQHTASKVTMMVKTQLQEYLGDFNNNMDTMRDAVEHAHSTILEITNKIDEFKDSFQEIADHLTETTNELNQTITTQITEATAATGRTTLTPTTAPPQISSVLYAAAVSKPIDPQHTDIIAKSAITNK